jgi:hypothetical protein
LLAIVKRTQILTYHAQAQDHTAPEEHVVQKSAASDPLAPLHHDNWHLKHHRKESVAPEFSCDTTHDKFMRKRRDEERYGGSDWARHVIFRRRVDMATEEMVDRFVPVKNISTYVGRVGLSC